MINSTYIFTGAKVRAANALKIGLEYDTVVRRKLQGEQVLLRRFGGILIYKND